MRKRHNHMFGNLTNVFVLIYVTGNSEYLNFLVIFLETIDIILSMQIRG